MTNPRNETLRDEIATIIQTGAQTTKSADDIAGEIIAVLDQLADHYAGEAAPESDEPPTRSQQRMQRALSAAEDKTGMNMITEHEND